MKRRESLLECFRRLEVMEMRELYGLISMGHPFVTWYIQILKTHTRGRYMPVFFCV